MANNKLLLIYPELGFVGSYLLNVPISLVYAASQAVNIPDVEVEILDCRIQDGWREILKKKLVQENVVLAGVSVMSGLPVAKAYEISKLIKDTKDVPVVWGGSHTTILPEETLQFGNVDFCVRGFGSKTLKELVEKILKNDNDFSSIKGLCYKKNSGAVISTINDSFEQIRYQDLPYHLIEPFIEKYFISDKDRVFPIYTSAGCPYSCSFCISPVWYENLQKKWIPFPASEVVDHIEYLRRKFNVEFIYFYDDDTFVSFSHFSSIAKELLKRKTKVMIGVRGIRVNELLKMKPDDFKLLEEVGVKYIHIGLESGSQRMLDLMKKGITVAQSLEVNRRLKKYPKLTPMYNLMCGIPTETIEDLKETGLFMLRLSEENPHCIMFDPGKFIPYPGSSLFELSLQHGFRQPENPEGWSMLDQESDVYMPWYTPEYNQYIKMLQVASYSLSNWEKYLEQYAGWITILFRILKFLYKPFAKFRVKNGISNLLFEIRLLNFAKKVLAERVQ